MSEPGRCCLDGGPVGVRCWKCPEKGRQLLDAAISEADFQATVIDLARRTGWTCYHTHDSRRSEKGFPDLVLIHPVWQQVLFRELKTMRGKLTADQERWRDVLIAAGCDWRCWRPCDWPSVEMALTGSMRGIGGA